MRPSRGSDVLCPVRKVIPITSFKAISFVTRVTKARAGQGFKPCVPATRPPPFAGGERRRELAVARSAAPDVSIPFPNP
jgi:hypothetical protein